MSEDVTKKQTIHKDCGYLNTNGNLNDLKSEIENVIEEYGDNIRYNCNCYDDSCEISLYKIALETDEEFNRRINNFERYKKICLANALKTIKDNEEIIEKLKEGVNINSLINTLNG